MKIKYKEALDTYAKALTSSSNTVSIDNSMTDMHAIRTLSLILNSATVINNIIPIELLKLDKLEVRKYMKGVFGIHYGHAGKIVIRSLCTDKSNALVSTAMAHEYGHFLYENIVKDGDDNLLYNLRDLINTMLTVFMDRDKQVIEKYVNKDIESENKSLSLLYYLTNPTELFARAFTGIVLDDIESKYTNYPTDEYGFASSELSVFRDKILDLCDSYKKLLIFKEKESNSKYSYNKDCNPMLDSLSINEKLIIYKTECRFYTEEVLKHEEGNDYTCLEKELATRKYLSTYFDNRLSVKDELEFNYDENNDVFEVSSSLDIIKKHNNNINPIVKHMINSATDKALSTLKDNLLNIDNSINKCINQDTVNLTLSIEESADKKERLKIKKIFLNEKIDYIINKKIAINSLETRNTAPYHKYIELMKSKEEFKCTMTKEELDKIESEIHSIEKDAISKIGYTDFKSDNPRYTDVIIARRNWFKYNSIYNAYVRSNIKTYSIFENINDNLAESKSQYFFYRDKCRAFYEETDEDSREYVFNIMKSFVRYNRGQKAINS